MSSLLEGQLFRALGLTFEQMGFFLPTTQLEVEQERARPERAVEVAFQGPFGGRLVLAVTGGVLPAVVGNILGDEEALSRESEEDALGELANVICGNVLPGIAGKRPRFDLAPPRLLDPAELKGQGSPTCEVHVGIGPGRADLLFFMERAGRIEAGEKAA